MILNHFVRVIFSDEPKNEPEVTVVTLETPGEDIVGLETYRMIRP